MSEESLVRAGRLIPDLLVLSHDEQRERLRLTFPGALPCAVVAGDPRFDRMVASLEQRQQYRHAMGVGDAHTLVVVSSTWWERSLFGTWPDLLRQLMAELPVDRYRVAAVLHPHIWYWHGPQQVRLWLSDCLRSGLILIPPTEGWAAALVASDVVVGDHGAVTGYAAAIARPVLLAAYPKDDVASGSAIDVLGELAPTLTRRSALRAQIDSVMDDFLVSQYKPVADLVTSAPGQAAARLRAHCYELLRLAPPDASVLVPLLPDPQPDARRPLAMRVAGAVLGDVVRIVRHAADALRSRPAPSPVLDDAHLIAAHDHPVPAIRDNADIVFRATTSSDWPFAALALHPFAAMAVAVGHHECVVAARNGPTLRLRPSTTADDLLVAVSALYIWRGWHTHLPTVLRVDTGAGDALFEVQTT